MAAVTLGLGILIGLGVLFAWRRSHHEGDSSGGGLKRLAVLPFENLGDSASEYFADGVTDAVRGKLASLPELQVIASASASQYKRSRKAPQEIARELGVDYLLVGKIRWAREPGGASRVQVSPELMRVAPGAAPTTTWQQPFDAALTDVFQVQADIARRVTEALNVALGTAQRQTLAERPTASLTAYDWYLKGLYFWNKRTRSGLEEAAAYFQRAIAVDSGYARAYAGLADSYTLLGNYGYLAPQEANAVAKTAALRALRLDERLAEAHASLANVRQFERDYRGAEAEYRRAIELNPNYATAHQWYGELLPELGQLNKALAECRRAEVLDPLSPVISVAVGSTLYYQRRYDAALAQLRRAVVLDSTFSVAHDVLGSVYLQQRRPGEARAALHRAVELSSAPAYMAELAYAQAAFGARDSALLILHELRERALREYVSPGTLALVYTGLGDKDQAFTWLERGVSAHEAWYYDWADPLWDPLRADPRFTEHLKKLGLR